MANSDVPAPTPVDLARNLAADLQAIEAYRPDEWIPGARHGWVSAIRRALAAESRVDELQRVFDLRWKATQRAIARWRAEDPAGRKLEWPDHADLCCWLMDRMTTVEAECKRLRDELATERTVLRRTANSVKASADSVHRQELTYALVAALRNRLETGGHTNG